MVTAKKGWRSHPTGLRKQYEDYGTYYPDSIVTLVAHGPLQVSWTGVGGLCSTPKNLLVGDTLTFNGAFTKPFVITVSPSGTPAVTTIGGA